MPLFKDNNWYFVFYDYFTWQLTMTGALTLVPQRALQIVSKSGSSGDAELHTGTRLWTRPGYFSFNPSITLLRVTRSLTSMSLSFLATSITLSLPSAPFTLPSITLMNSSSSDLTDAPFKIGKWNWGIFWGQLG